VDEPDAKRRPAGRGVQDLTSGPIGMTLLLFALPVMGSNILQSLNGTANAIWVSQTLGEAALAATANANNVLFLMLGAVFGVSMAANLLIAQAVGAGDETLCKRIVGSSIVFFLALSIAVGVGGFLATTNILDALGTPPDARAQAIAYLRVIFLAMPSMYFFTFLMMAMRGVGDSRTPFWFSLAVVVLDIGLNPLLILGVGPLPRLGIAGSATATLISQTVVLAALVFHLYRTRSLLVLRRREWGLLKPDPAIIRTLAAKGAPMALQMLVVSGAALVLFSLVNTFGSHTAAAYGAALQLWTYVQMPGMAVGAAVSSMAAQNVGAGRMDRVHRIAWIGSGYAFLMTAGPIVLIYLIQEPVLRLLLPSASPAFDTAERINALALWGFVPFAMAFVIMGVVRATGAVIAPLLGMVIALWAVRIPTAYLLTPIFGSDAIWASFPLGSTVSFLLAVGYYRWGPWRKAKLLDLIPHGQAVDTGMAPPAMDPEEADAQAAGAASRPDAAGRPRSEALAE
jgi:putative MATE family efflux protein